MTTTTTQKALLIPAEGEKHIVGNNRVPTPGPKDVLVKIEAAALNPADWKVAGIFKMLNFGYPFISGVDGAGIVVSVGTKVAKLKKGDRILFQGWYDKSMATFQEYCIVPEALSAKIPDNLTFDQAAAVPLGLLTVLLSMYVPDASAEGHSLRLPPFWDAAGKGTVAGTPALILGGASSVGQYAIQVAKLAGYAPILTTASPHNAPLLTALGATHTLDRTLSTPAILAAISTALKGAPLSFIYDAISSQDTQALARAALAPGGKLVIVNPRADAGSEDDGKGLTIANAQGGVYMQPFNRACAEAVFACLEAWLADGSIKPNPVEVLPGGLTGVQDGLARLQAGTVSAVKLIVRPHETSV